MLCFVGSQVAKYTAHETALEHIDEQVGEIGLLIDLSHDIEWEKEGIWNRIHVQRLWVIAVLFEHCVVVLRFAILAISPSVPVWVDAAKEVLQFRIKSWDRQINKLTEQGLDPQQIQNEVGRGAIRKTRDADLAEVTRDKTVSFVRVVAAAMECVEPQLGSNLKTAFNANINLQNTHHDEHVDEAHFDEEFADDADIPFTRTEQLDRSP